MADIRGSLAICDERCGCPVFVPVPRRPTASLAEQQAEVKSTSGEQCGCYPCSFLRLRASPVPARSTVNVVMVAPV
nr:metallothionein-like protein 4B [Ipomoea batatas]GME18176.1 metallothionein-like protein 4B [Ipomoea batatas]